MSTYFLSDSSFCSFLFFRLWWQVMVMMTTSIKMSSPPATAPTMIINMFSITGSLILGSVNLRVHRDAGLDAPVHYFPQYMFL